MKLTKRILSLAAAAAVSISLVSVNAFALNLVYDATEDLKLMPDNPGCEFPGHLGEVGTTGAGRLALAGEPYNFWDDARGLGISQRENPWDAVDVTFGGLADGDYTMVVGMNASLDEVIFAIDDADGPYGTHVTQDGGNEAVLVWEFTVSDGRQEEQNRIRVKVSDLDSFYVKTIQIYEGHVGSDVDVSAVDTGWAVVEAPPAPPPADDAAADDAAEDTAAPDAAPAVTPPADNTADDDSSNTFLIVIIVAAVLLLVIIIAVVAKKKS